MQAQGYDGRPPKYTGMVDVLVKAFRHEGIRGLYKVLSLLCQLLKTIGQV